MTQRDEAMTLFPATAPRASRGRCGCGSARCLLAGGTALLLLAATLLAAGVAGPGLLRAALQAGIRSQTVVDSPAGALCLRRDSASRDR